MKTLFTSITFLLSSFIIAQHFEWATEFEGYRSWVTSTTTDTYGNVYSAVIFCGTTDFDPSAETTMLEAPIHGKTALQKLDTDGNLIWVKTFESVGDDNGIHGNGMVINALQIDHQNNLYLIGSFTKTVDFDPGDEEVLKTVTAYEKEDIFILKLNSHGNFLWVHTLGSEQKDEATDFTIDRNGDLCIIGTFCLTVDFDPSEEINEMSALENGGDVFILKLDKDGNFLWSRSIESNAMDYAECVLTDKANNIYIGGGYSQEADFDGSEVIYSKMAAGMTDGFLVKLNEFGDFKWVKTVEGKQYALITSMDIDTENNLYVSGDFTGEEVHFDFETESALLSSKGGSDIFLFKIANDELIWLKQFGGTGYDRHSIIEISAKNTLYISGSYSANIDVDPSDTEFILPHTEALELHSDFFLATITNEGNLIQAIHFNGTNNDHCTGLKKGTDGSVYLVGQVQSLLDLNPSDDSYIVTGEESYPTGYVVKLNDASLGLNQENQPTVSLYPNPVQDLFQIQLNKTYKNINVTILNHTGQVIQSHMFRHMANLQLALNAPSGIYLVKIETGTTSSILKLVKR